MLWAMVAILAVHGAGFPLKPPPFVEGFEADHDRDGLPDGWFDLAGASLVAGGLDGRRSLCLRSPRRGLPSRARRAFPLPDGARFLRVSFAFKGAGIRPGRLPPGLPGATLSLYDGDGRLLADYFIPAPLGSAGWGTACALLPVPFGAKDAILTLGLFGAAGTALFDTLSVEPFSPKGSRNFLFNPDFSLGSDLPEGWEVAGGRRKMLEGAPALILRGPSVASQAVPFFGLRPEKATLEVDAKPLSRRVVATCEVSFRDFLGLPIGRGRRSPLVGGRAKVKADVPKGACGAAVRVVVKQGEVAVRKVGLELLDGSGRPLKRPVEFSPPLASEIEARGIAKGSTLDASNLLDPPAGKHGRVVVEGDRLRFEDGTPAKFFGVALRPPALVPDADEAAEMAELLSRAGVNLVKMALPFSPDEPLRCLLDPFAPSPTLSEFQLERFDRLVAELAKRGIYVALELWGPSSLGEEFDPRLRPLAGLLPFFSAEVREAQKRLAKAILSHKNPYRGTTYAKDPAVAFFTLTRGPTPFALLSGLRLPEELERQIDRKFNRWLLKQYKSRAGLAKAWKHLTITELEPEEDPLRGTVRRARQYEAVELVTFEPSHRLRDTVRFYAEVEREYFREMASFLRGLGLKGPLSACTDPSTFLADLKECAVLDIIEVRAVFSPTGLWSPVSATGLGDPMGTALVLAFSRQVAGKPYVLNWAEEGATHSNPVEPAHLWLLTALCAEKGVDAVVREFVLSPGESRLPSLNVVNSLPHLVSQLPLASRLFHGSRKEAKPKILRAGEEDLTAGGSPLMFLDPVEVISGNFAFSFVPEGEGDLPKGRAPLPFVTARSPHVAIDVLRGRAFGQFERAAFVGGVLGGLEFDLGVARLRANLWLGTASLVSLDERPLRSSKRLLFSCLGRLFLCRGASYADPFGLFVAHPGDPRTAPLLERAGFSLLFEGRSPATAWALRLDGSKHAEIKPRRTKEGALIVADSPLVEIAF